MRTKSVFAGSLSTGMFVLQVFLATVASAQTFDAQNFDQERVAMLKALSRPIEDCLPRYGTGAQGANADSPMFHGCWDWHSAVHAAYSLYSIYRHTGDASYRTFVETQVRPELFSAELNYMSTKLFNNSSEITYGNSWFLALARERELATGATDMRPLAEYAAQRIRTLVLTLTPTTARTRVLNTNYSNLSWALMHLDMWAKFTGNDDLRQFARSAAQTYLFDPVLDGTGSQSCPVTNDVGAATNFFSPCLLRLAAVAKIFGAEQADWIKQRMPDGVFVEPILVAPGDISHVNGDNWSRSFALWWIYQATNQETVRANSIRILVDHFAQPDHWDISSAYDVSHWVAQYAVRMIDSSYEPNDTVAAPEIPLQIAIGDSWALGGTGPLPNPNGYASLLQQSFAQQLGSSVRFVDIGKATGTATTANLVSRRLPYALDLIARWEDTQPAPIQNPLFISIHTGFDVAFATPTAVQQCGTAAPEQCNALLQALAAPYSRALGAAADDWSSVRANLNAVVAQLRAAAPRTAIVIGTYDNGYRTCNLPATVRAKAQSMVGQYLEGGGGFSIGLNGVIRQVAAANGIAVAEISGLLGPGDWAADCFNPSDTGHAKIAQAFRSAL